MIPIQHTSYVIFTLLPRGERKQTELATNLTHIKVVILHTHIKKSDLIGNFLCPQCKCTYLSYRRHKFELNSLCLCLSFCLCLSLLHVCVCLCLSFSVCVYMLVGFGSQPWVLLFKCSPSCFVVTGSLGTLLSGHLVREPTDLSAFNSPYSPTGRIISIRLYAWYSQYAI